MKRFVTYLYECERGNKTKNVGFIRVNVRGEETVMEVYIRNLLITKDKGQLFVLISNNGLFGIELGTLMIANGQGDSHFSFETQKIEGTEAGLNDIVGIGIRLETGTYIASCWNDAYAEEITRGIFKTCEESSNIEVQMVVEEDTQEKEGLMVAEEPRIVETQQTGPRTEKIATYEKIDLSQIRDLPSPNWNLATNSFLVHGFWNYGYLVLKKDVEEDKETLWLGIPGIFEKPEAVMAVLFGFPTFEEVPQEMVKSPMNQAQNFPQKEKNQEAAAGTFGCWFVGLKT